MSFYIERDDGKWYAGTVDHNAVWVSEKEYAAPFSSREQAEVRIKGLPEDRDYEIER